MSAVGVLFLLGTACVWWALHHPYHGKEKGAGEERREIGWLVGLTAVMCHLFIYLSQTCSVFRGSLRAACRAQKKSGSAPIYLFFTLLLIFYIAEL